MENSKTISHDPFDLYREIVAARSIEELRRIGVRLLDAADEAVRSGVGARNLVQLISRFNDAVTLRLISLLESSEGIHLPEGAAFLVLGSEGRGEQTLRTDQDNAIVYADDVTPDELRTIETFAARLVAALEEIGVPRCPGGIMASNSSWRHSIGDWKNLLDQWMADPTAEHTLNFGMLQDLRPLYGAAAPALQLRDHIRTEVHCHAVFFPNMAAHVDRFSSPFTVFGNIRVEQSGAYKGMIDLKKAGIFAITNGASLMALEAGMVGGDTWSKLERLGELGFLSHGDREAVMSGFTFLVQLRLQQQLRELRSGVVATNYVDPCDLADADYDRFRQALKSMDTFLWIFRDHYLLDTLIA